MVPKLFFFIQATILSTASSNCVNDSFPFCGFGYLKYPFWGGSRGLECGRHGFQIFCNAAREPLLNISSLLYIVNSQLDFSTNTLKLSRQDLIQSNACPHQLLRNTTLDLQLFRFPPSSTDRNLTLYLDCRGDGLKTLPPNHYKCGKKIHLYTTADNSSGPGPGVICKNTIFVPVNQKNARALEDPTASSVNILRSAISSGFSVQWLNQSDCGADVCVPRQPNASVNVPERRRGLPPVQSPGNPPQSIRDHRRPGNGSRKGERPARAKGIVIVAALTVVGVIILSITILCALKRRPTTANTPNQEVENFLLRHGSLTPKRFRYSEIKKITKSFSDKLGQGGYGSVYKGMLPNGCHVAVKVLVETDTNTNGEEFINEVASISRTSHVNVVALLGFCYEGNRRALVYEYMPNNSLGKFLNPDQSAGSMDCCLGLENLFKIAVGTAKGLEYLHTGCTTRIVHFDIKPQNILLDEDFCPKISDFGLAKLCKKKQSILSVLGTRGTAGYIAPEVLSRNFGGVSHKSDVYSYGMMLLEMVGARKIAEAEANQSSENYFPDKIYEQVIIDVAKILDGLMIEEEEERRKMILVGFWCIQTIPSSRPSISKVVEMLEGSLKSIQIPPKPFLFSPADLHSHEMLSASLSAYVETQNSAQY